jgi:formylglycine-generating enzyme required for sulfatase activity
MSVPLYFMKRAGYVIVDDVQISLVDGAFNPISVARSDLNPVGTLLPSPDGAVIAVRLNAYGAGAAVTFFDALSRAILGGPHGLPNQPPWNPKIAWSPDGKLIVAPEGSEILPPDLFDKVYSMDVNGRLEPISGIKRFRPETSSSPVSSKGKLVMISQGGHLSTYSDPYAPFGAPASWKRIPAATRRITGTLNGGPMKLINGGAFTMGRPGDRSALARTDSVTVRNFWLDETEVTSGAYAECVQAGMCSEASRMVGEQVGWSVITGEAERAKWSGYCNGGKSDRLDRPINCVDWHQATAYCQAVGKRLPTEEELEWAAQGAEKRTTFPWGKTLPHDHLCWSGSDSERKERMLEGTCAVGSHPRGTSLQGVKDLIGNVDEWTSTGTHWGPMGPPLEYPWYEPMNYVVRGGGWNISGVVDTSFRSSRWMYRPTHHDCFTGFRCARDAE